MNSEINSRLLSLGSAGMRGVVGSGLNPECAGNFAAAFATLAGEGPVLVGIDPRSSAEMFRNAVASGICGCGCDCIDGGILTAGMMHYLVPAGKFAGGILITGGHQAAGWNALLPIAADGSYFDALRQRELFDLYHGLSFNYAVAGKVGRRRQLDHDMLDGYWENLASLLDVKAIAAAKLSVVADFCNGAGAAYGRKFAETLHIELTGVNDLVAADIPRDPEPRPRSASSIRSVIRPLGAAAGLVFNRDMSRLGIVADTGEPLSEEMTFPLAADYLLEKRLAGGCTVVTNVCSSRTLDDVAANHGAQLERCRVGEANVIEAMRSAGAQLAGEGSGAFTFGEVPGFDAFLMAGVLLESIAVSGLTIGARVERLPRYQMVKQTIPCDSPLAYRLLRDLRSELGDDAEISDLDGLRFDWEDGFLSLRLSKTESILRLISESRRIESAEERALRARTVWERPLR
ncbi:MAG: hypothetical protein PHI35_06590 [Victivallaceae bacterium]|nr:hypothetical protein [Victivallaceae bacterium]